MLKDYNEFLKSKQIKAIDAGFEMSETNPLLFQWQNDIVRWALAKGKACIFADCGLGKTAMQLWWAKQVNIKTNLPVLIFAPLAVSAQTVNEGIKFGVDVKICRNQEDVINGVNVTNYEILEHFDSSKFGGVVLDESSIIKNFSGVIKKSIIDRYKYTPYKLCCTATPAPNDYVELGSHSEFLGVMSHSEMLSTFFCHDGGNTSKWRLKGHAKAKFFEWISSWACSLESPADLGYPADDFVLPELRLHEVVVSSDNMEDDSGQYRLVPKSSMTLSERRSARRSSLYDRVEKAAEIANSTDEQVLVWCDLNDESAALADKINDSTEVRGSDTTTHKEKSMTGFTNKEIRVLVSKPSIAGWGMNWQMCHKMIFVGLSDSFEAFYQAVRRCWRFGQKHPVDVYIITSDDETAVKMNIERKQEDTLKMKSELVNYTKEILKSDIRKTVRISENYYAFENMEVPEWLLTE